jgi:hypothetical protein
MLGVIPATINVNIYKVDDIAKLCAVLMIVHIQNEVSNWGNLSIEEQNK